MILLEVGKEYDTYVSATERPCYSAKFTDKYVCSRFDPPFIGNVDGGTTADVA
jgi:hypothetical protein